MKKNGGLRHTWTQSPGPAEYAARGWVEAKPTLPKGWRVVGMPPPAQKADVEALAFDGLGLNDNPSAGPAAIGINIVRFREATDSRDDAKVADVAADLVNLGASFVRQPADDLTWPYRPPLKIRIPVVSLNSFGRYDIAPIRAIFQLYSADALLHMFEAFDASGISAMLTVLTLGQAGTTTADPDPLGELAADSTPLWLWDAAHIGATVITWNGQILHFDEVESVLNGRPVTLSTAPGPTRNWLLSSMDIRSPYKRQYMQFMAQAACDILLKIVTNPVDGVLRRLASIELFNEINLTCRTNLPAMACPAWAKATASALHGVTQAFRDAGVPLPGIGLPSMGGGSDDTPWGVAGTPNLMAVLSFLNVFLFHLNRELGSLDAFDFLDVHWYYFIAGHNAARPGACVVQDVRETKKVLAMGGSRAHVTLCETGVPSASGLALIDLPAYPMLRAFPTAAQLDSFQAREVWRRIAVGLASGAKRVAWHTHRALVSGGYHGCGLRDDSVTSSPAFEAQRPSWGAFERVFERLLRSTAASGTARLLWPTHAAFGPDFSTLNRSLGRSMTLVVEFTPPGGGEWLYLAMIDSVALENSAAAGDNEATVTFTPRGTHKGPLVVRAWDTLPQLGASTVHLGGYPTNAFSWGGGADPVANTYFGAFARTVRWGAAPLLLSSAVQFDVTVA